MFMFDTDQVEHQHRLYLQLRVIEHSEMLQVKQHQD
jgi:hypothetical protein